MKKIINFLVICIVIMVTFFENVIPVFANITENTNKGNIIVSNLESGVKVDIYRIATVNYDYVADQPKDVAYTWNLQVKNWINSNYPNYVNPEKFYEDVETMSDNAREFYDKLTNAIKSGNISINPTSTKEAEGKASYPVVENNLNSKVIFENQEMGTYLIIIENGYMVYTPSVINLVPKFDENNKTWILENQTAVIKATAPKITKTVTNMENTKDNYSTKDTINYLIEADIPTYLDNSLYREYYISDNLGKGLTLNKDSLIIYGIKGNSSEQLNNGYVINYDTPRPNHTEKSTFVISFDYEQIKKFEKIKVEYTAKLNQNDTLILGNEGNSNNAHLDYTNNPYVRNSEQSNITQDSDEIKVYTYGIELEKVDKNNPEIKLSGAKFTLSDKNNNLFYFIKNSDGVYYLGKKGEDNATTNLVVDNNGLLSLRGLDEGEYIVTETHAPDKYNISTTSYEVEIKDTDIDGNLDGDIDGIFSFQFPDTKEFMLPLTGGRGVYLFVISGVIFIIIGIIVFIRFSKKEKNNKRKM